MIILIYFYKKVKFSLSPLSQSFSRNFSHPKELIFSLFSPKHLHYSLILMYNYLKSTATFKKQKKPNKISDITNKTQIYNNKKTNNTNTEKIQTQNSQTNTSYKTNTQNLYIIIQNPLSETSQHFLISLTVKKSRTFRHIP